MKEYDIYYWLIINFFLKIEKKCTKPDVSLELTDIFRGFERIKKYAKNRNREGV